MESKGQGTVGQAAPCLRRKILFAMAFGTTTAICLAVDSGHPFQPVADTTVSFAGFPVFL